MPGVFRILSALLVLLLAVAARAQTTGVTISVDPDRVGLNGYVRPGEWTPMLVTLDNQSAERLKVACEWAIPDSDGDEARMRRVLTLDAHDPERGPQPVWLYASPTVNTKSPPDWRV